MIYLPIWDFGCLFFFLMLGWCHCRPVVGILPKPSMAFVLLIHREGTCRDVCFEWLVWIAFEGGGIQSFERYFHLLVYDHFISVNFGFMSQTNKRLERSSVPIGWAIIWWKPFTNREDMRGCHVSRIMQVYTHPDRLCICIKSQSTDGFLSTSVNDLDFGLVRRTNIFFICKENWCCGWLVWNIAVMTGRCLPRSFFAVWSFFQAFWIPGVRAWLAMVGWIYYRDVALSRGSDIAGSITACFEAKLNRGTTVLTASGGGKRHVSRGLLSSHESFHNGAFPQALNIQLLWGCSRRFTALFYTTFWYGLRQSVGRNLCNSSHPSRTR